MVAVFDPELIEIDLPGDLDDVAPYVCPSCLAEFDRFSESGLCPGCAQRLPGGSECKHAIELAVSAENDRASVAVLDHLIGCAECRRFFETLRELSRVAHMEATKYRGTPQADVLPATA